MKWSTLPKFAGAVLLATATGMACAQHEDVTQNSGFIKAHPDMYWRALGQRALKRNRLGEAFSDFRRSARYADKASQAAVAAMLWNGWGVAKDRPLAYAWSDLAAERGYKDLLAQREKYWSELSLYEQARAKEVGEKVYAEFGDDVAKPRMNVELQRVIDNITGSHLGHVGTLSASKSFDEFKEDVNHNIQGFSGSVTDGSIFFADQYWKPELYWKWRDAQWNDGAGRVEVLPIQPVSKSSEASGKR